MNAGATSERVYDSLKRRILSGEFRPTARLDPAALADSLAASVTPVRDALHQLVGEGLVATRTSEGFHMPAVHEPGLRDLYLWNLQLIGLALGVRRPANVTSPAAMDERPDLIDATALLFATLVQRSGNTEHQRAVAMLNDRLHIPRTVEPALFDDLDDEFVALRGAWRSEQLGELRRLVASYHRRRVRKVAGLVRALYQGQMPAENNRDIRQV